MLRFYILACIMGLFVLVITDPIKGLGIIAFFGLVFGVPVFFAKGKPNEQDRK
jgi:hypothetical protein